MSKFLERHKKKGLLALLLLLFRQRKVLTALLLVVVLLSLVFIAPSNFNWVAAKLGMGGVFGSSGGAGSFAGVKAAFRAARDGRDLSWSAIFGWGTAAPAASSVGLVRGDAAEFGLAGAPSAARAARSVNGILNRDDAKRAGPGVSLDDADLAGERAELLARADRSPNQHAGPGGAAYVGRDFFAGDRSAGTRLGDNIKNAIAATSIPNTGGGKIVAGSPGRLSPMRAAKISYETRQALNRNITAPGQGAFAQLAEGRSRSMMARDPNCTAANGCPAEYAATNVGAAYDGNKIGPSAPQVIAAPEVDNASVVSVPGDSLLQGYFGDAEQAQQDAQNCKEADKQYTPREQYLSAQLQKKADDLNAMSCNSGGCSQSKARRCRAKGVEMHNVCLEYYSVQCAHINACPLTKPDGCPTPDCDR